MINEDRSIELAANCDRSMMARIAWDLDSAFTSKTPICIRLHRDLNLKVKSNKSLMKLFRYFNLKRVEYKIFMLEYF